MAEREYTEEFILDIAKKAYDENPDFAIAAEKCVLLVIDMQDEFVKPGWTPYWIPMATEQVPAIKGLIEECRRRKIPVIFTVFPRLTTTWTDLQPVATCLIVIAALESINPTFSSRDTCGMNFLRTRTRL
jgi:nicotinamidase-related amidase